MKQLFVNQGIVSLISLCILLLGFLPNSLFASPQVESSYLGEWLSLDSGDEIGRYFRKADKIYVHLNGMISEELKDSDYDSFRVSKISSEFGRDKSHVWFIAEELKVDPATWQPVSESYSKDRSHVYCGVWQLPDADPSSFRVIKEGLAEWGADKESVYSQWFKLENSDPDTFQLLDSSFSKDRNNVYHFHNRLEGADPASFRIININVGRDNKAIYAFGKKMPSFIDMPTVRVPGDGYIYDKNGRYHLYKGEWLRSEENEINTP